jgi:hypothetical protein
MKWLPDRRILMTSSHFSVIYFCGAAVSIHFINQTLLISWQQTHRHRETRKEGQNRTKVL